MYNGSNGQALERTHTTHEGAVTSTSLLRILPSESKIPTDPETSVAGGAGGGEVISNMLRPLPPQLPTHPTSLLPHPQPPYRCPAKLWLVWRVMCSSTRCIMRAVTLLTALRILLPQADAPYNLNGYVNGMVDE